MNTPTKIVFVHLLNDFSGSPLVLSNVVRGMQAEGYACDLITCRNSEGFLSNLEGVNYRLFAYHWHANRWLRLFLFLWSQVLVFAKIWAYRREKVIIYVNTLLPFGATLAGKLLGKKVVVHVHESSLQPAILKGFLRGVANFGATKSIFVSTFLSEKEQLPAVSSATVHNALSDYFKQSADNYRKEMKSDERFRILMLCSLKAYKGVHEFVEIARKLPELHFELVINAGTEAIEKYFATEKIPENLDLYPSQKNVHPFYQRAHLVLNLSHPEQWVETFGMTLLEGMYYGLPCIAPPVGGPTEIVRHQQNGFLIDQRNLEEIISAIRQLVENQNLYREMAHYAQETSRQFSYQQMMGQIKLILQQL